MLFETARRQRFLAFLAHNGPSRLTHVLSAIGARNSEGLQSLINTGVLLWDKPRPNYSILELNPDFPGIKHLAAVLRKLEPRKTFNRKSFVKHKPARRRKIPLRAEHLLGGNSTQSRTRALICLEAYGGQARSSEIARTLSDSQRSVVRRMLDRLVAEGFLIREPGPPTYRFKKAVWTGDLRQFLAALGRHTDMKLAPPPTFDVGATRKMLDYRKPVVTQTQPKTWRPPSDGAPLLFGTDARRRVLCALASGPVRRADLERFTRARDDYLYNSLEDIGLIVRFGNRSARYVALNPRIPARKEFIALLKAINEWYSPILGIPRIAAVRVPDTGIWKHQPLRFFGSPAQTEALLLIAAAGELDASLLCKSFVDRPASIQTVLHLLHKLAHQQVLRQRQVGKFIRYQLDAASPIFIVLNAFVKALLRRYPVYRSSVRAAKHIGTHRARQLRESRKSRISYPPAINPRAEAQ